MRLSLSFFIGLVLGFAVLINALPSSDDGVLALPSSDDAILYRIPAVNGTNGELFPPADDADPATGYHDYSTMQLWIGSNQVSVGIRTGSKLYLTTWDLLDHACPGSLDHGCKTRDGYCFKTRVQDGSGGNIEGTTCYTNIQAEWENEQIRRLLIGSIAGAAEALARDGTKRNCFDLKGEDERACSIGDEFRVFLPGHNGYKNYIAVKIINLAPYYGTFYCCLDNHRADVDKAIDGLGNEIGGVFGQKFTRDTRCIINGGGYESC